MTNTVSDEIVEMAVTVFGEAVHSKTNFGDQRTPTDVEKAWVRGYMRAALETVAPLLRAEGLRMAKGFVCEGECDAFDRIEARATELEGKKP
jgi:hypothetical protein